MRAQLAESADQQQAVRCAQQQAAACQQRLHTLEQAQAAHLHTADAHRQECLRVSQLNTGTCSLT